MAGWLQESWIPPERMLEWRSLVGLRKALVYGAPLGGNASRHTLPPQSPALARAPDDRHAVSRASTRRALAHGADLCKAVANPAAEPRRTEHHALEPLAGQPARAVDGRGEPVGGDGALQQRN
jgi:hypothetical protein